jgi:SSS family solute:Na+ symporter
MPLLFLLIEQDMAQRCFAAASARIVSTASLLAGVAMLCISIVPVFFGCLAKAINLEIPQGSSVLMVIIAKTTNPCITALAGCAVLAAIISSATSLINAIGANLSHDFKFSVSREAKTLHVMRWITCSISIASIFFAFYFDNIVDVLVQSYELSVSCLFIPLFISLFKKKGNFLSALLAIIFGSIGFFLFRLYPIHFPKEVGNILLSLFGFSCGEIMCYYRRQAYEVYE